MLQELISLPFAVIDVGITLLSKATSKRKLQPNLVRAVHRDAQNGYKFALPWCRLFVVRGPLKMCY